MPYIATFEALKSRAKAIDPDQSSVIDKTDVRNVALLVDRYPAIVPSKYARCACECTVEEGSDEWVVEFDAASPRSTKRLIADHATA